MQYTFSGNLLRALDERKFDVSENYHHNSTTLIDLTGMCTKM